MTAQYNVIPCATLDDARAALNEHRIDLVMLEMTQATEQVLDFCRQLRVDPDTVTLPVIAMGLFDRPDQRMQALAAGVDEVLEKPMSDMFLMARIRSLLRARAADDEMRLRDDTSRALGFAERGEPYVATGKVVLVSPAHTQGIPLARALSAAIASEVKCIGPEEAGTLDPTPDLFILDARFSDRQGDDSRLFRAVADLRSRRESRHSAQLVLAPENGHDTGAMALDLGANDVAPRHASAPEIGLRARALIRRKVRLDQLRDTVQTGLRAAVTDPLTGLYNRRYALPHLRAMAERSRTTGRPYAIMVADIDHFKAINDTWGHTAGDKVIAGIADLLRDNLRSVDLVARIGGEEFLVAMPDTTAEQAEQSAERLRFLVQNCPVPIGASLPPVGVTLSIGVTVGGTCESAGHDIPALIDMADAALYSAKSAGRNMVSMGLSAA